MAMLRNKFRRVMGILIVVVFGLAIVRFAQQTSSSQYIGGALASGAKFLLFLAVLVWGLYLFDRRMKKREP
jgi:hypothetical protein